MSEVQHTTSEWPLIRDKVTELEGRGVDFEYERFTGIKPGKIAKVLVRSKVITGSQIGSTEWPTVSYLLAYKEPILFGEDSFTHGLVLKELNEDAKGFSGSTLLINFNPISQAVSSESISGENKDKIRIEPIQLEERLASALDRF